MSKAEDLFGEEHVRRYRETDGEVGHIWRRGSKILLLTTKGRTSGEPRTAPLIYEDADGAYVIVASKGGSPEHPGWYKNLAKEPQVELQVKGEVFPARARTASGEERERLWKLAALQWPEYDAYQKKQSERSRWSCSSAPDRRASPPTRSPRCPDTRGGAHGRANLRTAMGFGEIALAIVASRRSCVRCHEPPRREQGRGGRERRSPAPPDKVPEPSPLDSV